MASADPRAPLKAITVADYGGPFAGSFLPMLTTAMTRAEERGWSALAVLPERARERDWLPELTGAGHEVAFVPEERRGARAALARLLDDSPGPTVLHTHFSSYDLAAQRAARGREHVRLLWHVHTVLSDRPLIRAANLYKLRVAARGVERILCVAPHLCAGLRARGADPERVLYFPNGLDVEAYTPAGPAERAAARERLSLPAEATVLLHFGRAWETKGGDVFMAASAELMASATAEVIALSSRGGEPARAEARRLGIEAAVRLPDDVSRVQDLFDAADLFLATSRGEGMPLAVLEALASGLPVVASDIPGHELPGADPPPNLSVVALEPRAVAAAARELLTRDPAVAAAAGAAAREWVGVSMGLDRWADRLMALYAGEPQ